MIRNIRFNILILVKLVLISSIFLSFITYTIDRQSSAIFYSRLTLSAGLGIMVIVFFSILYRRFLVVNWKKIVILFYQPLIMLFCFLIVLFFSLNKKKSLEEVVIVGFLVVYAILLIIIFKKTLVKELLPILIVTALTTSVVGLYDVIATNLGWFTFFNIPNYEAVAGFRWFGQAGHYIFIFLIILIPLKYTPLEKDLPKGYRKLLFPTIILAIIFLVTTGKIAAIIGFGVGVSFFIFLNFLKVYKDVLISLFIFLTCFFIAQKITPKVIENVVYRVESRITNRVQGTPEADFVVSNFKNAIKAFKDNPITGTGLGAYQGVYADTEIHGTYLKMLGETGLIGVFGYLAFMGSIIYMYYKATKVKNNTHADFLIKMIPFFIGFLVCQAYCYHLRKLEFWILYAVLFIAYSNFNPQIKIPQLNEKEIN
jgi:O-antigen ligase